MIQRHTLKNGLRVVAQKSDNSFATSVLVMIKTGSRNETADIHGISHFLEHMCFKGTKKRPGTPDIAKEIDSMGARNNAFTSKEYTGYYIQADKKHFVSALDILSDMVFHSTLMQKEIEKESGTIIEEINMYEDTPISLVPDLFEQILFENILLAQNVIGKKETVQAINTGIMKKYRDKYYKAGNAVVSCAGNLPDDYLQKIEKFFGSVGAGGNEYIQPEKENKLCGKRVFLRDKDTEQAHIYMGVESYSIKHPMKYAQKLLAVILGGNMSSRLFTEIREKRGLAYYVSSGAETNFDSGLFKIRAGLNTGKTEEAVKIIKAELERSKKDITGEEVKRAKDYTIGNIALSEENSMNVAEANAWGETLGVKPLTLEERIKLFEKVTLDEVTAVANEIFKPENLRLAVIGPFKTSDKFVKILEG